MSDTASAAPRGAASEARTLVVSAQDPTRSPRERCRNTCACACMTRSAHNGCQLVHGNERTPYIARRSAAWHARFQFRAHLLSADCTLGRHARRIISSPALQVWDFDWSLVEENSDTWVLQQLDATPAFERLRAQVRPGSTALWGAAPLMCCHRQRAS